MATMVGLHGDLKSILYQLIELDYDAVDAYRAAIERLKDVETRSVLMRFMDDHQRHVAEVSAHLRAMGGEAPRGPGVKRALTRGKVVIAALLGDRAILKAMKTNEDDMNTAYERASKRHDAPLELRALLARNLTDERRHRQWIEQRLAPSRESAHP